MEIITISIFLGFALILFALSKMVKDFLFVFISGITFVLVGLSIFTTGVDIQSGLTENIINSNVTNTIYTYSTQDPITTHGLGIIIVWLGLYIVLVSWDMYKKEKEESFLGDKPEV